MDSKTMEALLTEQAAMLMAQGALLAAMMETASEAERAAIRERALLFVSEAAEEQDREIGREVIDDLLRPHP